MNKCFSALLLSVISLATIAADDPWFLLEKTAYAARELNYQGIFVYQNGKETHSVQITHMNQAGREMTRIFKQLKQVTQPNLLAWTR
jgi:sigma-E factor negative regulatory protein RseB